jgi:hypothetical protein
MVSEAQTDTFYILPTLSSATVYYWYVVAKDPYGNVTTSSTRSFTSWTNDPVELTLQGPANDSTGVPLTIELAWSATDDEGEDITYDVYFGTDNPPSIVYTGYTSDSLVIDTLNWQTTFYWKVIANDTYSNITESSVKTFSTTTTQAPVIVLLQPADSESETGILVDLQWTIFNDDNDSVYLELYFGRNSDPALVAADSTLETMFNVHVDTLQYSITYYWKVTATDNETNSTETSVYSFSAGANDAPVLTLAGPANDSTDVPLTVDIKWSATDDENDDITYDISFGTTYPPAQQVAGYTDTIITIDTLSYFTNY